MKLEHIKPVVEAIRNFPDIKEKVEEIYMKADVPESSEYEICVLCQAESLLNEGYVIAKELIYIEQDEDCKEKFSNYIEEYFKSKDGAEAIAQSIKSVEDSRKMTLAISIIDEYLTYLDGDEWDGPKNSNLESSTECINTLRRECGIDNSKYIDTIQNIACDSSEYKKLRSLLGKIQNKELLLNELAVRLLMERGKEEME